MLIARAVERPRGSGLNRVDMRYLEARVVRRQRDIGAADEGQVELKLDLARADVGERRGIVERRHHAVAVTDGDNVDWRRRGRPRVEEALARRTRVGGERSDPPAVHGDALRALREEQVDDV